MVSWLRTGGRLGASDDAEERYAGRAVVVIGSTQRRGRLSLSPWANRWAEAAFLATPALLSQGSAAVPVDAVSDDREGIADHRERGEADRQVVVQLAVAREAVTLGERHARLIFVARVD